MSQIVAECVEKPVVSVVTPVYNTADYLEQCIESVLDQTWTNYEYLIVDNRSTDASSDIAHEYAEKDARIRVVTADRHRPQSENYNYALKQMSASSKYCKIVQADDWIFPECIEQMIDVAESDVEVAAVGCYFLVGSDRIEGVGLPPDIRVFSGRAIARRQLLTGQFFLGSPTSLLYRNSVVRSISPFFDPAILHDDTDVGYKLLAGWKFGFVPQVLAYERTENESISSAVRDINPKGLDKLLAILAHGRKFLSDAEYEDCLRHHLRRYARTYIRNSCGHKGSEYRRYHQEKLREFGYRLPYRYLIRAAIIEVVIIVGNPLRTLRRLLARLGVGEKNPQSR